MAKSRKMPGDQRLTIAIAMAVYVNEVVNFICTEICIVCRSLFGDHSAVFGGIPGESLIGIL
jgi:hypothetical protein